MVGMGMGGREVLVPLVNANFIGQLLDGAYGLSVLHRLEITLKYRSSGVRAVSGMCVCRVSLKGGQQEGSARTTSVTVTLIQIYPDMSVRRAIGKGGRSKGKTDRELVLPFGGFPKRSPAGPAFLSACL
jgi:hypothetical protein